MENDVRVTCLATSHRGQHNQRWLKQYYITLRMHSSAYFLAVCVALCVHKASSDPNQNFAKIKWGQDDEKVSFLPRVLGGEDISENIV